MIDFKVINAGDCMVCGKPIILPASDNSKQLKNEKIGLPDIFFCEECATRVQVYNKERGDKNDSN